jgi:excinuclease UvrABC helicase subunit UvrB
MLDREALIATLEQQMREAAAELDFELAAQLRDQIFELKAAGDLSRRTPRGVHGGTATRRRA